MKAYINEVNWADEGNIFFFSLTKDEKLQAIKELLQICEEFDLISYDTFNFYWGTNQNFEFNLEDIDRFINDAVTITDDELSVLYKFNIHGFDIYERIEYAILDMIYQNCNEFSKDELYQQIIPLYRIINEFECKSLIFNYNNNGNNNE